MSITVDNFIKHLEEEFEDLQPGKLQPDSKFREFFEWNSINALIIIAMVSTNYDVTLTADDMNSVTLVSDLFRIVESRMEE